MTTIKAARSPQTSPFGKSQTVKIDKSAPAAKMNSRAFAPFPTNRRGAGAGVSSKAGRGFARHLHTPERPVLYSVACKDYILRLSYCLIYCLFFVLTAGRWIDSIDVIDR